MTTIAIANQKGGCGKTTTAINLSACLAKKGQRVLLIDMDPQGHASLGLGQHSEDCDGLYEVLLHDAKIKDVVQNNVYPDVDLIPATISLAAVEHLLNDFSDKDKQLTFHLETLAESQRYDFIIIDCPPQLSLLAFNAFHAAERILIPVDMSIYALEGIDRLADTIDLISEKYQRDIPINILPTMVDYRTRFTKLILDEISERFQDKVITTPIHYTTRIKEAAFKGQPVIEYKYDSLASSDYSRLADNYIRLSSSARVLMAGTYQHIAELLPDSALEKPIEQKEPAKDMPEAINDKLSTVEQETTENTKLTLTYKYIKGQDLKIAGDFNNWIPDHNITTQQVNGLIHKILNVAPGTYQYRLIVDGKWIKDPHNSQQVLNSYGELNSLLKVETSQFEIA